MFVNTVLVFGRLKTGMGFLWLSAYVRDCFGKNMREAKIFIDDFVSRMVVLHLDVATFENRSASVEIFALEIPPKHAIEKCCVT